MPLAAPAELGAIVWNRNDGIGRAVVTALSCGIAVYGHLNSYDRAFVVGCSVLAAFLVIRVIIHPPKQLRLHENGVSSIDFRGVTWITTTELNGFRCSSKSGSTNVRDRIITLTFASLEFLGLNGKRIRHRAAAGTGWELTRIQGFGISTILDKMAISLQHDQFVDWTPTLRITADGIDYRRSTSEAWSHLSMSDFRQGQDYTTTVDGIFCLLTPNDCKQVHAETLDSVNFFPGFYLLQRRFARGEDVHLLAWGEELSSFEMWIYGTCGSWW